MDVLPPILSNTSDLRNSLTSIETSCQDASSKLQNVTLLGRQSKLIYYSSESTKKYSRLVKFDLSIISLIIDQED